LIDDAHKRAVEILTDNKEKVKLMTDMLMEFETLDSTDIKEIMEGSWSIETKRARVKTADQLQINTPPPAPAPIRPLIKPQEGTGIQEA
jgi:cell division protease FtsH